MPSFPLAPHRLDEILGRIPRLKIAVVGDFFLDKYLVTDPALSELSVETGLEARQVVEVRCSPGAAGTVTNNLSALGTGRIAAVGVIGDDGEGYELLRGLAANGVETARLIQSVERFTPTYTKPMVRTDSGETELERLDIKNRRGLPEDLELRLIENLRDVVESERVDAVIIADQVDVRNSGVVTDSVRAALARLADRHPNTVFIADSRARIGEFTSITLKPNRHEAARALECPDTDSLDAIGELGRALAQRSGRTVFVTVGEEGILICSPDTVECVPAIRVTGPVDIVGAGDSTTAGIVTALCAGATHVEAAALGNLCASVTIRKLGTTGTASPDELRAALGELVAHSLSTPNAQLSTSANA